MSHTFIHKMFSICDKLCVIAYENAQKFVHHQYSSFFLGFVSFIESIFFPVPTDPFLIVYGITHRERIIFYTIITILFSVLGGMVGYWIGSAGLDLVQYYTGFHIEQHHAYYELHKWLERYGAALIIIGGFTPVPFKVVAIFCGATAVDFTTFVVLSLISRGMRFALIGALTYYFGDTIIRLMKSRMTYVFIALALIVIILYYMIWH